MSKRFHFSLQTVHNLREAQREEAERGLSRAAAAVDDAAAQLDEAKQVHASATEAFALRLRETEIDPQEAALSFDYLAMLVNRQRAAHVQLQVLEAERETRRGVAVEAARAAEATTRLRERQYQRHALQAARAEQDTLDEMATLAQARRLSGATR